MRGKPPIPNSIKRLSGDGIRDSGGRLIPDEPTGKPGIPATPSELTGDALTAWHDFIADTEGMDVITLADRGALIILCQTWGQMLTASKTLAKEGLIITLPNDIQCSHPALKIYRDSASMVLKLLQEFGMSPSARSRIHLSPSQDKATADQDEFADRLCA